VYHNFTSTANVITRKSVPKQIQVIHQKNGTRVAKFTMVPSRITLKRTRQGLNLNFAQRACVFVYIYDQQCPP